MKEAKKYLKVPDVVDGELEPGAHIWCYCCSEEVPKHCTDGDISVAWGGVIEHMYWLVESLEMRKDSICIVGYSIPFV